MKSVPHFSLIVVYQKLYILFCDSLFLKTGFSGNMIILSVFYYGGIMMNESQITVGELSSFLLYAAFVGVSIGG